MTLAKSRCGVSSKKLLSWASMSGCMSPNPGGLTRGRQGNACPGDRRHYTARDDADASRQCPGGHAIPLARCKAAYSPHEWLAACSRVLLLKILFITYANFAPA